MIKYGISLAEGLKRSTWHHIELSLLQMVKLSFRESPISLCWTSNPMWLSIGISRWKAGFCWCFGLLFLVVEKTKVWKDATLTAFLKKLTDIEKSKISQWGHYTSVWVKNSLIHFCWLPVGSLPVLIANDNRHLVNYRVGHIIKLLLTVKFGLFEDFQSSEIFLSFFVLFYRFRSIFDLFRGVDISFCKSVCQHGVRNTGTFCFFTGLVFLEC